MLDREYVDERCAMARALELVGERWTLLIVREAFFGVGRFDEFQRRLGVSRNILTSRLSRLVEFGVFDRRQYSERPKRFEYRLTARGRDLFTVMLALTEFGERHAPSPDGPTRVFFHKQCGQPINTRHLRCDSCGVDLDVADIGQRPGPGATGRPGGYVHAAA